MQERIGVFLDGHFKKPFKEINDCILDSALMETVVETRGRVSDGEQAGWGGW